MSDRKPFGEVWSPKESDYGYPTVADFDVLESKQHTYASISDPKRRSSMKKDAVVSLEQVQSTFSPRYPPASPPASPTAAHTASPPGAPTAAAPMTSPTAHGEFFLLFLSFSFLFCSKKKVPCTYYF